MANSFVHPVLGQEAVCPDGLGRVVAFKDDFPETWIQVDTYVANRGCKWGPGNVKLVPIASSSTVKSRQEVALYRLRRALQEFDEACGDLMENPAAARGAVIDAARAVIAQF